MLISLAVKVKAQLPGWYGISPVLHLTGNESHRCPVGIGNSLVRVLKLPAGRWSRIAGQPDRFGSGPVWSWRYSVSLRYLAWSDTPVVLYEALRLSDW